MANVDSAQYISETYIVWRVCVYKRTQLRCAGHISNMPARIKGPFTPEEQRAALLAPDKTLQKM